MTSVSSLLRSSLLFILAVFSANVCVAQPFAVPAPNIPINATGISPTLGVSYGTVGFADYNADGHLDFIVTGRVANIAGGFVPLFSAIYRNRRVNINGLPPPPPRFDYVRTSAIEPVWLSAHAWEDIDGDGDLDLALSGATAIDAPFDPVTIIYQFNAAPPASGDFVPLVTLDGMHSGSLQWGDFDNDGDADLLASGILASGAHATRLLRNNDLTFEIVETSLDDIGYGEAQFVDVDNDLDLDIVLAGVLDDGNLVADIYRNDDGVFSILPNDIAGVSFAAMDWADYDADGDVDMVLSGGRLGPISVEGSTVVYNNNGAGILSATNDNLITTYYGDTDWIDYDRDGDLDITVTGLVNPFTSPRTLMLLNNGGSFSAQTIGTVGLGAAPVVGLRYSASAWGDFDEDNDLDFLVSGETFTDSLFFALYGNVGGPNFPPNAPGGLSSNVSGQTVTLSWNIASDFETPSSGLSYNIIVGTTSGGPDVVAPNSNSNGKRLVVRTGNVGSNTSWRLDDLPAGTYFWNVQSIDTDLTGSSFSVEQTFVIN